MILENALLLVNLVVAAEKTKVKRLGITFRMNVANLHSRVWRTFSSCLLLHHTSCHLIPLGVTRALHFGSKPSTPL
jgi:hypothetical protein